MVYRAQKVERKGNSAREAETDVGASAGGNIRSAGEGRERMERGT